MNNMIEVPTQAELEYCEAEFIKLRKRFGTMIFTGWDISRGVCTFVDANGKNRKTSLAFLLGYLEGFHHA